jgi:hypothetical protein
LHSKALLKQDRVWGTLAFAAAHKFGIFTGFSIKETNGRGSGRRDRGSQGNRSRFSWSKSRGSQFSGSRGCGSRATALGAGDVGVGVVLARVVGTAFTAPRASIKPLLLLKSNPSMFISMAVLSNIKYTSSGVKFGFF